MNKSNYRLQVLASLIFCQTLVFSQNPIVGGGEDCENWVERPKDRKHIVYTAQQLKERLDTAEKGDVIYVDDNSIINLDDYSNLEVKSGVTLASGRGRDGSLGGKLVRTKKVKNEDFGLLHITGDNVRVTGIRIEGPDKDKKGDSEEINNGISIYSEQPTTFRSLIIDNNEIFGWQKAGVEVRNVKGVLIEQNHIHHCLYRKVGVTSRGYGVVVYEAGEAHIKGNLFDHNRHDVACDGHPVSEYTVNTNLILNGGISHSLDVHGWHETQDITEVHPDGSYFAGLRFSYENNIILSSDKPHIFIRGNSEDKIIIKNNYFSKKCKHSIKHSRNGGSGLNGLGATRCANVPSFIQIGYNVFRAKLPSALFISYSGQSFWTYRKFTKVNQFLVGEFSGDKRHDLFTSLNGKWLTSESGKKEISEINSSDEQFADLRIGDFDGNGRSDVFRKHKNKWWVSNNGTGTWQNLNSSKVKLKKLRFGDFDGDGKTDVLYKSRKYWQFSYGGTAEWKDKKKSKVTLNKLLFGDFNGDKRTDILGTFDGHWWVSWSGSSDWDKLNTSSIRASKLSIGDFNGDGIDDVFNTRRGKWYVSWGVRSKWEKINESDYSLDKLILGDFNGDGKTDIGVVDKFW